MEKSALKLAEPEPAPFIDVPPLQHEEPSNVIAYPRIAGVALVDEKHFSNRARKWRRKLARFLKLEAIALSFLVLTLAGATSQRFIQSGLTVAFEIAMVASALAVAIIPVIFYGPSRQKYRYRARRSRG